MAFPQDWIADVIVAKVGNVSPCQFDIVGFNGAPAAYYKITQDFICFRMRLNGCPKIQDKDRQKNSIWGVQIRNDTNEILFIARVYVTGNSQKVQIVTLSDDKVIYEEDIYLHNGTIKSETKGGIQGTTRINIDGKADKRNVQVLTADITDESVNLEYNYFLDFKLPRNQFIVDESEFDFDNETFKLYYFTSVSYDGKLNIINIIEEQPLCGKIINPTD